MSETKAMGRPRKPINKDEFEKLCSILCTEEDIANWFNCSVDTINRFCKLEYDGATFAEAYKKLSVLGRVSIRRKMFEMATDKKKPNVVMLIWLSKNVLGMKEPKETDQPKGKEAEPEKIYPALTKEQALKLLQERAKDDGKKR